MFFKRYSVEDVHQAVELDRTATIHFAHLESPASKRWAWPTIERATDGRFWREEKKILPAIVVRWTIPDHFFFLQINGPSFWDEVDSL